MKRDFLTFLLFLVLATLVWYGHALQSVRNARVPVFIQYTGRPGTIGLGARLPDTIQAEVRDAGARLIAYYREPLHLTIDLHPYIHGDKGTIQVPSDALRRSISDILQGTSSLIETQPEEISCPYFTEQEKTVTVVFDGDITLADEYQIVGRPKLSRNTLKLFGQDKTLSSIDTIYTERISLSELSDTTCIRTALTLPAHTRAEIDSIDVCIIAERFTEKKFIVPLHAEGIPEGYQMRLFPNEVEVSVRMGMMHFAQVQASDIKASCTYSPERKDKLDVTIHYTNPYITTAWAYPGVVEFILEQ